MSPLEQASWYLWIFLGMFFTGIGLPPVPEEVMIAAAAALTTAHDGLNWWWAWPTTILGIVAADTTLYAVGRAWGPRLFEYRWVQKMIKPERRQRLEKHFALHGTKILLTARLLPPLRTGVFMVAGAIRYPLGRFLLCDLAAAFVGASLFFFGSQALVTLLLQVGHEVGRWLLYLGALGAAGYLLYRYYRHLRARELKGTATPPISILEVPAPTAPAEAPPPEAPFPPPREPSPKA